MKILDEKQFGKNIFYYSHQIILYYVMLCLLVQSNKGIGSRQT